MKYYKMVSGKGRVLMSENEISSLFNAESEQTAIEPSQLERLEEKVETLSKRLESLSKIEVFKALLSLNERTGENDGAS